MKSWILHLAVVLASAPVAHASFEGGIGLNLESQFVFVLKHPDPARPPAFVRVSEVETFTRMTTEEGYEVVAQQDENGETVPALGRVLPAELVAAEASSAESHDAIEVCDEACREEAEAKSLKDRMDLGLGLNLGLTTGLKARVLAILDNGFMVGVDLDIGTILFISDATASVVAGWQFMAGNHALRPYVTVGVGGSTVFAILAVASGTIYKAGVGFEWKPARWFGLGIEGGVAMIDYNDAQTSAENIVFPWGRLNVMFYFL
ncbi:MAG: hypothetical protein IT285_00125 [Bdellovibrionales bacterium]|nr:hypothetical protein [Bdellovibrionales bacterium]